MEYKFQGFLRGRVTRLFLFWVGSVFLALSGTCYSAEMDLGSSGLTVRSDRLVIKRKENRATFSGNVVIKNDTVTLVCDRYIVRFSNLKKGWEFHDMEAFGGVEIVSQDFRATAGYAHIDVGTEDIILKQKPTLRTEQGEFRARTIRYNSRSEELLLEDNVRGSITPPEK